MTAKEEQPRSRCCSSTGNWCARVAVVAAFLSLCACAPTLTEAARQGNEKEVRDQLRSRPSQTVNRRDEAGWGPLHYAASRGHERIVQILLSRGADPGLRTAKQEQTALHLAASRGHVEVCRQLLHHGADANAADASGWTTLHSAVLSRKVELGRLLLRSGADLEVRNRVGLSATELARRLGHLEFAESIERGDDGAATVSPSARNTLVEGAHSPVLEDEGSTPLTREEHIWAGVEIGAATVSLTPPGSTASATGNGVEARLGLDEPMAALPRLRLEGWGAAGYTRFESLGETGLVPAATVHLDLHLGANVHTFLGLRLGASGILSVLWFSEEPTLEEDALPGFALEASVGRRWWLSKEVAIGAALRARHGWNLGESTEGWWTRRSLGLGLDMAFVTE